MSSDPVAENDKQAGNWHRRYWVSFWAAFVLVLLALRYWAHLQIHFRVGTLLKFVLATIGLAFVVWLATRAVIHLRRTRKTKILIFAHIMVVALFVTTVALLRFTASYYVAPWPQRDLRPILLTDADHYNSWGMRDQERTIQKDPDTYRIVFIGDSFLEGVFCKSTLPELCEQRLQTDQRKVECVNLGVSATGPIHYYHRLKNVAQRLSPDAVCLVVYGGNDFLSPAETYSSSRNNIFGDLVAEPPKPSLLGAVMPKVNWLLINRLRMNEHSQGLKEIKNESALVEEIAQLPVNEATDRLAKHMHQHYFPNEDLKKIEDVLSRGGESFWSIFRSEHKNSESLRAWWVHGFLQWELLDTPYAKNASETDVNQVGPYSAATQSWIIAIKERCDAAKIPLIVVLAPVGSVDPEFVEYYQEYPRAYSFNYYCDARYNALKKGLQQDQIDFIDLKEVLEGKTGVYRKSDAHWSEKGHEVVADYLTPHIKKIVR